MLDFVERDWVSWVDDVLEEVVYEKRVEVDTVEDCGRRASSFHTKQLRRIGSLVLHIFIMELKLA
jgi:hypothetical protein